MSLEELVCVGGDTKLGILTLRSRDSHMSPSELRIQEIQAWAPGGPSLLGGI